MKKKHQIRRLINKIKYIILSTVYIIGYIDGTLIICQTYYENRFDVQ